MTHYQPTWYKSPIDLPERKVGKFSIRHRIVKDSTPIIGARQAYTRGLRPLNAKLSESLIAHELFEEGKGIWMTDLPEELNQIEEMLYHVKPQGRVLVGGLGLGIVAKRLTEIIGVKNVTVVEQSLPVIRLCANGAYTTICADIQTFLDGNSALHQRPFDFYLLDTWCGTGENTWWSTVMPLRRAIRNRCGIKPVVHCWAEDIMLGQVRRSLIIGEDKRQMLKLHNAERRKAAQKPMTLQDCRTWRYTHFPVNITPAQADWFLINVGTKAWEKKYAAIIDNWNKE